MFGVTTNFSPEILTPNTPIIFKQNGRTAWAGLVQDCTPTCLTVMYIVPSTKNPIKMQIPIDDIVNEEVEIVPLAMKSGCTPINCMDTAPVANTLRSHKQPSIINLTLGEEVAPC